MEQSRAGRGAQLSRYVDLAVGAGLLGLAFVGVAASDVYGGGSQALWSLITLIYAAACLGLQWLHGGGESRSLRGLGRLAVHWLGVLAAIQLVYLFIAAGRLTSADDGLVNGAILALGTYLAGVHGDWRMLVIGVAVAVGTAAAALVEQYVWVLLAIGLIALAAMFLYARWRSGRAA